MSTLSVPGAEIHYETVGEGPLLVLIAGAQGSAMVYQAVAQRLKDRFTVLTYDRRGFSRSMLDGEQDYDRRLETDAQDVAHLIEHAGKGPAIVFGSSSGAIVALTVLAQHPEVVDTLVAHEPPACRLLPDATARIAENYAIYDKYKAEGISAAMQDFAPRWLAASDRKMLAAAAQSPAGPQIAKNMTYWFEHELRQYPAVTLDMPALQDRSAKVCLVAGEEMRDYPPYSAASALAQQLGLGLSELPGGHIGYSTQTEAFALALIEVLEKHTCDRVHS